MRATNTRRLPRLKTVLMGIGVLVALAITLTGISGWILMREAPLWWRTVDAENPDTRQRATQLENAVQTEFTRIRSSKDRIWGRYFTPGQANDWLNTNFRSWIAELVQEQNADEFVWPTELAEIQVDFDQGNISIGTRLDSGNGQVIAATVVPEIRADGSLWMPAKWIHVGRLRLPAQWVLSRGSVAESRIPKAVQDLPELELLVDVFAGRKPIAESPRIRLPDGRAVQLLALQAGDDRLLLYFETLGADFAGLEVPERE